MRSVLGVLTLVLLATLGVATPAQGEGPLPQFPTAPEGDVPGVNDWTCEPGARRPSPVILVHGTMGDRRHLLEKLSTAMLAEGYCVFSLDYGNRGLEEISHSAKQLKGFTQRVLKATGAEKVSMVGHSQGGMMPRYYIKFLGGARLVDDLVGIAPSNHGTAASGPDGNPSPALVGRLCEACIQQTAGSPFLRRLNAGDETPGKVSYTQITTRYDEVVVPHTSGYLESGPRTVNVTIQDLCRRDVSEHLLIPVSNTTVAITLDALGRRGPARVSPRLGC